jgi:hypothetical protein
MRAGTASTAGGPIFASTCMTNRRTDAPVSLSTAMRAGTASAAGGPISPSTSATNRRTYTLSSLSAAMRAGIAFNPISSSPNFCTVGRTRLLLRILVCKSLLQKLNLMQRLLPRWGFVVCEHRLRARSSTVDQKPGSARAGLQEDALQKDLPRAALRRQSGAAGVSGHGVAAVAPGRTARSSGRAKRASKLPGRFASFVSLQHLKRRVVFCAALHDPINPFRRD